MTDNEIIKALECCQSNDNKTCRRCCFRQDRYCREIMAGHALDLINRQKAEIDILIRKKHTLRDEIERLNFLLKEAWESIEQKDRRTETIKSEAYKEFAERLCKDRVSNDPVVIAVKVELSEVSDNA